MNIRSMEKSKKMGFLFYISYNGGYFKTFDEMSDKKSVKGTFAMILNDLGVTWAKGIQQGARTDSKVSANENILYISSNYSGDMDKIKDKFNKISDNGLKILSIKKTLPNLVLPDMIKEREYLYRPQKKYIKNSTEDIIKLCEELSGKYDVSEFTDKKSQRLKEHIRKVSINYDLSGNVLKFLGDSFMPHQVRIMSAFILCNEKKIYPAKFLTLNKLYLKKELNDTIFEEISNSIIEKLNVVEDLEIIHKIEKNIDDTLYIIYVDKKDRGSLIGKNGNNIKKLKEKLNKDKKNVQVVVKEI